MSVENDSLAINHIPSYRSQVLINRAVDGHAEKSFPAFEELRG